MKNTILNFIDDHFDIIFSVALVIVGLVGLSFFVNILPFLAVIGMVAVVGGAYCTYENIATARYIKAQNSR